MSSSVEVLPPGGVGSVPPPRSSHKASPRFLAARPLSPAEGRELRHSLTHPQRSEKRASDLLSRFLLAEVVNRTLGSLSLDELLHRLVALAAETLNAERGTIFLLDAERDELYSRVAQGDGIGEIRIPRTAGIAGVVFASGRSEIVDDAYGDPRFDASVDRYTGYHTRSLVCAPLRRDDGSVIGTFEVLNTRHRKFDGADLLLLEAIASQAAATLDHARAFEHERRERAQDRRLLEMTEAVSVELDLDRLLGKIVAAASELLDAERASLFVHDPEAGELFTRVTSGGAVDEIRIADDAGIAGATFRAPGSITVGDAYADPRFDRLTDIRTGFKTASLLSVPVLDQAGTPIAVLQVLNKRAGPFTGADERRLLTFATQVAIALQNAQLFTDVLALKKYTDTLLRSLPDGVITLDRHFHVLTINDAARKLLAIGADGVVAGSVEHLWGEANPWLIETLAYVVRTGRGDHRPDVEFALANGAVVSVNVTAAPLGDTAGAFSGVTLILQDIDRQKKVQATITRYMAKEFAECAIGANAAGTEGSTVFATMLFSDIRRFTALAEALSPQATVDMLNEYFSEMAKIVQQHGGVLDKYIGDAVMAVFGAPVSGPADADNAAATASQMIRRLKELNLRRLSRGARPLEIGVGLASGEIVAGPVGSPARKNYTVIGDAVNLAARLESANKQYGTTVLVAGTTVERFVHPARLRRIDLIRVKGKEVPTEISEILDYHDTATLARLDTVLAAFDDGIRRYRAREWARALAHFADFLKVFPNDGPSWVYTDRCPYHRDHAPPEHWDGVWTMKTK